MIDLIIYNKYLYNKLTIKINKKAMNKKLDYNFFLKKNAKEISSGNNFIIVTFYKFFEIKNSVNYQVSIKSLFKHTAIKGTILIASEGINGTIVGLEIEINKILKHFWLRTELADLNLKYSLTHKMPFFKMKVRLKKEIVTLGINNISPSKIVGQYVEPEDWNDFIADENVILIDTRNNYEVSIGSFENATNPNMKNFRDFPNWASKNLFNDKENLKDKKIAMFCTGGIRCEKSTSYLKSLGLDKVYHLNGGILKYLEKIPEHQSKWKGSCFVFDYRVSVKHDLKIGDYDMCFACRMPITQEDKKSNFFEQGQSCHNCFNASTNKQKTRFKERQKQIKLSKKRNERFIGNIILEDNQ